MNKISLKKKNIISLHKKRNISPGYRWIDLKEKSFYVRSVRADGESESRATLYRTPAIKTFRFRYEKEEVLLPDENKIN